MGREKGSFGDFRANLNLDTVRRTLQRLSYYSEALCSDLVPEFWQSKQLHKLFNELGNTALEPSVKERVNYYNKLAEPVTLTGDIALSDLPRSRSRYFYDIMSVAKPFGGTSRLAYLYGDIKHVPEVPSFVKSRPIAGDNSNSILLNLNKFRHFRQINDPYTFMEKSPTVVWRGRLCNKMRMKLAEKFEHHPSYDIGYSLRGSRVGYNSRDVAAKQFLSVSDQCRHRYILSLEGNDVATSLKWIMSSNSLCLSPALVYETWFMEGKLKPDVHFAEVKRDFSDLEEKIAFFEENPDAALEIIGNAKTYRQQFFDKNRERLISFLVVQKYLERSGQRKSEAFSEALFT